MYKKVTIKFIFFIFSDNLAIYKIQYCLLPCQNFQYIMNNIKEVSSQTFDICNKRNVEAAIVETATRTELSVEYSVPSVNMNVQTEDLDYGALTFRSRSRSLDRQQISRVLQKLFLARRILNPVRHHTN